MLPPTPPPTPHLHEVRSEEGCYTCKRFRQFLRSFVATVSRFEVVKAYYSRHFGDPWAVLAHPGGPAWRPYRRRGRCWHPLRTKTVVLDTPGQPLRTLVAQLGAHTSPKGTALKRKRSFWRPLGSPCAPWRPSLAPIRTQRAPLWSENGRFGGHWAALAHPGGPV